MRTKKQNYWRAHELGAEFVANLIETCHRNPARKLKGLVNLLEAGHSVRTGSLSMDLVIDDCAASWVVLEEWAHRTQ